MLEDHACRARRPTVFRQALQPLLSALSTNQIRATFFVVGTLCESWKSELRDLAAAGHEVGLHGYTHRLIRELGEKGFAEDLRRGVGALGDVLGNAPAGYRAPYFGLTRATSWAPQIIQDAGFVYSSSVLPAWNPQASFAGAPRVPFRWKCGLPEFPVPVAGIGRLALPILGGAYLRLSPGLLVRLATRSLSHRKGAFVYVHPYDFDPHEPLLRRPGQSRWFTWLLFARRERMLGRVLVLGKPGG